MIITLSILAAVAVGPSLCNPIISPNTTIPINHSISADRPPVQHPKGWKPPMDPLDPSTYNGDVLNVTRCHCADPDGGIRKGYYYQYDYYNWHENAYYTAHRSCDSRKHSHLIDHGWQPHCWSRGGWATFHKACGHRTRPEHSPVHPGKFCFQIEALRQVNLNYTWADMYFFKKQTRDLDSMKSWYELDNGVCRDLCPKNLRGMVVAEDFEGSGAITVRGPEDKYVMKNEVITYTDLDDMCNGCRKFVRRSGAWVGKMWEKLVGILI